MMRKEQADVEPGHKIEKENARDKSVLCSDEVKDKHAHTGNSLAETEPMAEEYILQKVIFGAAPGDRFQPDTENDQPAVNAVTPPGELGARAGRIERHHHPNAKPEKQGDDHDLAEQEEAVETFRALRDHV